MTVVTAKLLFQTVWSMKQFPIANSATVGIPSSTGLIIPNSKLKVWNWFHIAVKKTDSTCVIMIKVTIDLSVTANIRRTDTPIMNDEMQSEPWSNNIPIADEDPTLNSAYSSSSPASRQGYLMSGR